MACLIKAPRGGHKGCVSFTTQERDRLIRTDGAGRASVASLKRRYFVGLHHNWHDHDFVYDPLFDFSMAGEGDLIERSGRPFERIPLDACNFAPGAFKKDGTIAPFWDVICTSRAVFFKGLPEFLHAIRSIYDRRRFIRVLHLCPVPPANPEGTHLADIRQRYEAMFSPIERRFFNLITMEWDNPFPLDLDTLAHFYKSSRVYIHTAPEERRARAAAYAWAAGLPVVCRENIASILPPTLRRKPFWFGYEEPEGIADALLAALDQKTGDRAWAQVAAEFSMNASAARLERHLEGLARVRGEVVSDYPINPARFDLRLGRHQLIGGDTNSVEQTIPALCNELLTLNDDALLELTRSDDAELLLAGASIPPRSDIADRKPDRGGTGFRLLDLPQQVRRLLGSR